MREANKGRCQMVGFSPRIPGVMLTAVLLVSASMAVQADGHGSGFGRPPVTVATYNQYLGADLAPLLTASSAPTFNTALLHVLEQVAANRFRARAHRQAALIAASRPDLVGLQEVWDYRCQDLPPAAGACASPSIRGAFTDQLALTLAALEKRGVHYKVAAEVQNFDTAEIVVPIPGGELHGLPFTIGEMNGLLLAKDRDVILARAGVATTPVTFNGCRISVNGCTFQNVLELSIAALPGVQLQFKRGYVGVNAIVRGKPYSFVNTHLEIREPEPGNPLSMFFQSAQAAELIAAIHALPQDGRKLILVGDTNSAPTDASPVPGIVPPYQQFAAAGYLDAWTASRGTAAGFTCCQAADLRNKHSELFERIDLILVGTPPLFVRNIKRLGENPADKTIALPHRPALWPSDHAGLTAVLQF